jgi:outer membrane biosynthesis protein TonB
MARELPSIGALFASLLLHAALGSAAVAGWGRAPENDPSRASELADRWAGETFEVDAVVGQSPAPAAPPAAAAAEPAPTPPPSAPDESASALALEREKGTTPSAAREPTESEPSASEPKPVAERRQKPRKKKRSERPSQAPATEQAAAAPSSSSEPNAAQASGTGEGGAKYGAEGQPSQVRSLAKAFTRALPEAARRDKRWTALPLGSAGKVSVTITLDDEGRITEAEHDDTAPKHLQWAIDKSILLLKGGQFALGRETVAGAGTEKLEIVASVSMRAPSDDSFADPTHTIDMGFETPRPEKPGKAYFTLASGRHVELEISLAAKR